SGPRAARVSCLSSGERELVQSGSAPGPQDAGEGVDLPCSGQRPYQLDFIGDAGAELRLMIHCDRPSDRCTRSVSSMSKRPPGVVVVLLISGVWPAAPGGAPAQGAPPPP